MLFGGSLEIRVGACGMIGDVDDVEDLGHSLFEGHFDPLAKRHRCHAASLTAPAETQERSAVFDGHQLGESAMSGDCRIDLVLQHPGGAFGNLTGEFAGSGRVDHRAGTVGVLQHQSGVQEVVRQIEHRAFELVDRSTVDDHRKTSVLLHQIVFGGICEVHERRLVRVSPGADSGDGQAERDLIITLLAVEEFENAFQGLLSDVNRHGGRVTAPRDQ